ncbi:MAG: hypothetical protein HYR62_04385 [Actinobacteria bacterium]|nr:hypothetical protein [Actinomycetota bacterium]MBI3686293.1 hypothetical protein [Actinomycetota bacterium]
MNATPATQRRLLDLQAVDLTLAQLAHRRGSLPELAEIARLEERLSALSDEMVRVESEINDVAREQRRLELDVDQVRQRAVRDQQRMDSGAVGSPRELESLQHEIRSLGRRQSNLEDQVLELMERRELVEGTLVGMRAEAGTIGAQQAAAVAVRDAAWSSIDAEASLNGKARDAIMAELPADLLALYQKLRGQSGGVGAAALRGTRCEGCRLELAPSELARVRAASPETVLRCEECGRILVRPAESAR